MQNTITDKKIRDSWNDFLKENQSTHIIQDLSWCEGEDVVHELSFEDIQSIYFSDINSQENIWNQRFSNTNINLIKRFFEDKLLKRYGPKQLIHEDIEKKEQIEKFVDYHVRILFSFFNALTSVCSIFILYSIKEIMVRLIITPLIMIVLVSIFLSTIGKKNFYWEFYHIDGLLILSILLYISHNIGFIFIESKNDYRNVFSLFLLSLFLVIFVIILDSRCQQNDTVSMGKTKFRLFLIFYFNLVIVVCSLSANEFVPDTIKIQK